MFIVLFVLSIRTKRWHNRGYPIATHHPARIRHTSHTWLVRAVDTADLDSRWWGNGCRAEQPRSSWKLPPLWGRCWATSRAALYVLKGCLYHCHLFHVGDGLGTQAKLVWIFLVFFLSGSPPRVSISPFYLCPRYCFGWAWVGPTTMVEIRAHRVSRLAQVSTTICNSSYFTVVSRWWYELWRMMHELMRSCLFFLGACGIYVCFFRRLPQRKSRAWRSHMGRIWCAPTFSGTTTCRWQQ